MACNRGTVQYCASDLGCQWPENRHSAAGQRRGQRGSRAQRRGQRGMAELLIHDEMRASSDSVCPM